MFFAQPLPGVIWTRNILHGMTMPHRVIAPEVEWSKIDRIIGLLIDPMTSDSDETLLQNILASDIEFDHAVRELKSSKPYQSHITPFIKANSLPRTINEMAEAAVNNFIVFAFL